VYHFELETNYFNSKRWMLNRLVSGYGVVCGLDVREEWQDGERGIRVDAGLAIDGYGREIVVDAPRFVLDDLLTPSPPDSAARPTRPGAAVQHDAGQSRRREYEPPPDNCDDDNRCCHVLLCYHECQTDPAPAHVSDCHHDQCHCGAVIERYRIEVREGRVPEDRLPAGLVMPDCIRDGEINYRTLVDFVSAPCPECPCDPCIALAEITVPADTGGEHCAELRIDIAVRPIVYSNDLLYQLLLCQLTDTRHRRR